MKTKITSKQHEKSQVTTDDAQQTLAETGKKETLNQSELFTYPEPEEASNDVLTCDDLLTYGKVPPKD